jgi:hypothetical protein
LDGAYNPKEKRKKGEGSVRELTFSRMSTCGGGGGGRERGCGLHLRSRFGPQPLPQTASKPLPPKGPGLFDYPPRGLLSGRGRMTLGPGDPRATPEEGARTVTTRGSECTPSQPRFRVTGHFGG